MKLDKKYVQARLDRLHEEYTVSHGGGGKTFLESAYNQDLEYWLNLALFPDATTVEPVTAWVIDNQVKILIVAPGLPPRTFRVPTGAIL